MIPQKCGANTTKKPNATPDKIIIDKFCYAHVSVIAWKTDPGIFLSVNMASF